MSSSLLGNNRVSEAEVISVPDVPFTRTFHPVPHRDVIQAVREGIQAVGLNIVKAEYVLAAEGNKMFGVYDLSQKNSELCWSIGIRNSMNKSMSLGITAGTRVFVCENLCFSGEFLAFRRHTSGLDVDELAFLAYRSMKAMIPKLHAFQAWHTGLRKYPLSETDLKILLVEIMTNNVISPSKFHEFQGLYANVYGDSLWGFHETVTDILKDNSLMTLPKKNKVLNQTINTYISSLNSSNDRLSLGDFYEQRSLLRL
ncbi:MAG: hypothetical protein P4L69_19010 [Desulfosporosinus sp.]|nr:hypothetical protein [Desulfosporosinus sp.]